ncbi:hypothetical protein EVAR_63991_1 [Eumeta japonica]|uniref:Uncharacterized protein n=1 Tax=Eumeta variegata TaxID=151549 RepID=A0A4C1Z314_EUMVA|nr:hypothetical protein EVAR_63991_1 [Eumeta japonica]
MERSREVEEEDRDEIERIWSEQKKIWLLLKLTGWPTFETAFGPAVHLVTDERWQCAGPKLTCSLWQGAGVSFLYATSVKESFINTAVVRIRTRSPSGSERTSSKHVYGRSSKKLCSRSGNIKTVDFTQITEENFVRVFETFIHILDTALTTLAGARVVLRQPGTERVTCHVRGAGASPGFMASARVI